MNARATPPAAAPPAAGPPATASDLASGKDHRGENFPVAALFARPFRAPVMSYYRFARAADDVSDSATAAPHEKLALIAAMRATLAGERDDDPAALDLRRTCAERGLDPVHGLDLLEAFRRDVTQLRYDSWDDLIDYCRWSAMPVGRFVLDVHGEDRAATWPASDALCAALQVINHLQDCGDDRRALDRIYIPLDALAAEGIGPDALDAPTASPALRRVIAGLAQRTLDLLDTSRPFAARVRDRRLAFDVAVIQRVAEDLCARLIRHDPLSARVHHTKLELAGLTARAGLDIAVGRGRRSREARA